jgi:hypothetical protein
VFKDSIEKLLLTGENDLFGGLMTVSKYKIFGYGALYETISSCISPHPSTGVNSS